MGLGMRHHISEYDIFGFRKFNATFHMCLRFRISFTYIPLYNLVGR